MTSMHVTASFSIMKVQEEVKLLLLEKLQEVLQGLIPVLINVFILGILIHNEIGDMLEIMFICNGLCYNKMSQKILLLPLVR